MCESKGLRYLPSIRDLRYANKLYLADNKITDILSITESFSNAIFIDLRMNPVQCAQLREIPDHVKVSTDCPIETTVDTDITTAVNMVSTDESTEGESSTNHLDLETTTTTTRPTTTTMSATTTVVDVISTDELARSESTPNSLDLKTTRPIEFETTTTTTTIIMPTTISTSTPTIDVISTDAPARHESTPDQLDLETTTATTTTMSTTTTTTTTRSATTSSITTAAIDVISTDEPTRSESRTYHLDLKNITTVLSTTQRSTKARDDVTEHVTEPPQQASTSSDRWTHADRPFVDTQTTITTDMSTGSDDDDDDDTTAITSTRFRPSRMTTMKKPEYIVKHSMNVAYFVYSVLISVISGLICTVLYYLWKRFILKRFFQINQQRNNQRPPRFKLRLYRPPKRPPPQSQRQQQAGVQDVDMATAPSPAAPSTSTGGETRQGSPETLGPKLKNRNSSGSSDYDSANERL
jgi:hypothetical protein